MNCGHGYLVKLCGLRHTEFSIHTPLLTAHHTGIETALSAYVLSWRPPTSSSAETGKMLSEQSTNQTIKQVSSQHQTSAVSDVTAVTVTQN